MDGIITAGVVAIGDEILRGDTLDTNTGFVCARLYARGVDVRRAVVIPDELDLIVPELRGASGKFDWVIACGGIGPTPDDLTRQAVAVAFDAPLELRQDAVDEYERRRKAPLNDGQREMCRLPAGAELVWPKFPSPPSFIVRNVLVLPGVPQILKSVWSAAAGRFQGPARFIRTFRTSIGESRWAHLMARYIAEHPRLKFGSYPKMDTKWWVEVRIEGPSQDEVTQVAARLEEEITAVDSDQA